MSNKAEEMADRLRKHFSGRMTAEEIEFLRDIQGLIDFAIRNDLNFGVVASTIGHDLNEIARDLFDLKEAKARGFRPKVAGYAGVTEESLGGEREPLD
jgi:hypothetical protein